MTQTAARTIKHKLGQVMLERDGDMRNQDILYTDPVRLQNSGTGEGSSVPYFERKPWVEATPPRADAAAVPVPLDPDFAAVASRVLGREAERKQCGGQTFRTRKPVVPGQSAEIVLRMANDGADAAIVLDLFASDLVGPAGASIPGDAVAFAPHRLTIAPNAIDVLRIRIAVPRNAVAGAYAGRVGDHRSDALDCTIIVDVRADH